MRRGTLLILGLGVKCQVIFGTLCIKPCGHDTDYSFWPDCKAIPAYGLMMSVRPSICPSVNILVKAGPLRQKQLTNTLKIRILPETSILYLIRYASIILTVGFHL